MSYKDLPAGYDCPVCDMSHTFAAYVYAHTHVDLIHTCDDCGAENLIRNMKLITRKGA